MRASPALHSSWSLGTTRRSLGNPGARYRIEARAPVLANATLSAEMGENHASTSARSGHGSFLHLWKGSSATVVTEFDALRYCRGADGACLPSAAPVCLGM
jgi:hypothetical protein